MNRVESLDTFDFDNNSITNDQVRSMLRDQLAFVVQGNAELPLDLNPRECQLNTQRALVN